jgi:hypothetical protein
MSPGMSILLYRTCYTPLSSTVTVYRVRGLFFRENSHLRRIDESKIDPFVRIPFGRNRVFGSKTRFMASDTR